ncbi:hypothetical protein GCU56_20375 [Geodermatophilus sabuli]|uniref:Uncharacterized protein n=1 Tax=Geodermatophilus sabuli TaxID=1564158 RepID=A0A7K3W8M1_9ACTN|nr:hypothetical protein [Geodermatophilus sabuli]NEK60217.1 hypothetical protein [Geodermatophilus sabuli]
MTSPYDWFADWVEDHVMVTLTATRGPDAARLLAEFGRYGFDQGERTLDATYALYEPTVRIGSAGAWVYAVEPSTVHGGDPAFSQRLTADGGDALAFCLTATIRALHHCRDGEYVFGVDIDLPHVRWGRDEHAYDQQMADAGLLTRDGPRPVAAAAGFVDRVFGFPVSRGMLEARLPCATVRPIGG